MATKKKKNNKVGFIFWFTFALLILVCFLIAKEKINKNLGLFYEEVVGEKPSIISTLQSDKKDEVQTETTIIDIAPPKESNNTILEQETKKEKVETSKKPVAPVEEKKLEEDLVIPETKSKEKPKAEEVKPLETPKIKLPLYFILINEDGTITRKEILRQMNKTTTPLTASINSLLAGPTADETNKGIQSVIPQGTKLLNASITNKTATLDFSEDFSFNSFGVEGYLGQLMQIVYTATSFTTIENVQFLIEGKKLEYIGEGVWIGTPLARSSFK